MFNMFRAFTWQLHSLSQQGVSGHQLPTLGHELVIFVNQTYLAASNNRKKGVILATSFCMKGNRHP